MEKGPAGRPHEPQLTVQGELGSSAPLDGETERDAVGGNATRKATDVTSVGSARDANVAVPGVGAPEESHAVPAGRVSGRTRERDVGLLTEGVLR